MSEKGWNTESLIKKLNDWYGLFNITNFNGRVLYSNEVWKMKLSLESGKVRVKSKNVLCALLYVNLCPFTDSSLKKNGKKWTFWARELHI